MTRFFKKLTKNIMTGAAFSFALTTAFTERAQACTSTQIGARVRADFAMDVETGAVLYAENADIRLSPASITKQIVALLLLEDIRDGHRSWDDTVYLSSTPLSGPGTRQNTDPIDWNIKSVPLKTALYAMLRRSSNRVPQSFESPEFVARMNVKAAQLELFNTHYVNTSGYPTAQEQRTEGTPEGHYSSAADIARIAAELHRVFAAYFPEEMEDFRRIRGNFTGRDLQGRDVAFHVDTSVNLLPGARYGLSNVIDGKTGYICRSGHQYAVTADIDGRDTVLVTTGYTDKNRRDADMRYRIQNPSPEWQQIIAHAKQDMSIRSSIRVLGQAAAYPSAYPSAYLSGPPNSLTFAFANLSNRNLPLQLSPSRPDPRGPNNIPDSIIAIRQDFPGESELQPVAY